MSVPAPVRATRTHATSRFAGADPAPDDPAVALPGPRR